MIRRSKPPLVYHSRTVCEQQIVGFREGDLGCEDPEVLTTIDTDGMPRDLVLDEGHRGEGGVEDRCSLLEFKGSDQMACDHAHHADVGESAHCGPTSLSAGTRPEDECIGPFLGHEFPVRRVGLMPCDEPQASYSAQSSMPDSRVPPRPSLILVPFRSILIDGDAIVLGFGGFDFDDLLLTEEARKGPVARPGVLAFEAPASGEVALRTG